MILQAVLRFTLISEKASVNLRSCSLGLKLPQKIAGVCILNCHGVQLKMVCGGLNLVRFSKICYELVGSSPHLGCHWQIEVTRLGFPTKTCAVTGGDDSNLGGGVDPMNWLDEQFNNERNRRTPLYIRLLWENIYITNPNPPYFLESGGGDHFLRGLCFYMSSKLF